MQNDGVSQPDDNTQGVKIIQTDIGAENGQTKCPKCGSTVISLNQKNGLLRCNYCRNEFAPNKLEGMVEDLSTLEGRVVGSGAQNIVADTNDVLTFKCSSCGAEVVINTASASQARCHWCRNTLSVNEQIPNGAIPDALLPFSIPKEDAKKQIEDFVGKRKFFAHPKFKKEFTTENIMGVYFPYMIIDANAHVTLSGQGEHRVRRYVRGIGQNAQTYYDADLYNVEREFDLVINGLTVESNSERTSNSNGQTNNVINAIMPFDTENCVKYDANYLNGFSSERRNTNIEDLENKVKTQSQDIARFAANESLKNYDRGVKWESENLSTKGQQWKTAYLPVWLYSYQQISGSKKLLHYVAVNARTKETMGSVPLHIPKLLLISVFVEIFGVFATLFLNWEYDWAFSFSGLAFFLFIYLKYRNTNARHTYETDTKTQISNLREVDNFVKSEKGLRSATMVGANNTRISNNGAENNIFNSASAQNLANTAVNATIGNNALASFAKNIIDKKGGKI